MDYRIPEELVNADDVHDHGLFIGNHSQNNSVQIDYFIETIHKFIKGIK